MEQEEIWLSMLEPAPPGGRHIHPSAHIELSRDVGPQRVFDALLHVIGHHEALRTEYIARDRTYWQAVRERGIQEVRVHALSQDEDLHQHALKVIGQYDAIPFRWNCPQSLLVTILLQRDRAPSIVMSICHLSADVLAVQNLEENIRRAIDRSSLVPELLQPLDQAASQKADFQATQSATEKHWAQILQRAPQTCLDYPSIGLLDPGWIVVRLDSVLLAQSIHQASQRAHVTVPLVDLGGDRPLADDELWKSPVHLPDHLPQSLLPARARIRVPAISTGPHRIDQCGENLLRARPLVSVIPPCGVPPRQFRSTDRAGSSTSYRNQAPGKNRTRGGEHTLLTLVGPAMRESGSPHRNRRLTFDRQIQPPGAVGSATTSRSRSEQGSCISNYTWTEELYQTTAHEQS